MLSSQETIDMCLDLYPPLKGHAIEKELDKVLVTEISPGLWSLDISYKIFHLIKHECCTKPEAVKAISSINDEDVKRVLSNNMNAKVLR